MNPLVELHAYGQSFWYDNIRRQFLLDGTLKRLIDIDGLRGMTSNPSIFEQAIGGGDEYDQQIREEALKGVDIKQLYESLALSDIRLACDLFGDLYRESGRSDGYVSLEVSPHLAHDQHGTIEEAERLFAQVDRPNVMIKVPATAEGMPAIRHLIGVGINVNVTLMFSMAHYESVAQAYIEGVERLVDRGGDPGKVSSVASFFVSRVDSAVDKQLNVLNQPAAQELLGKTAVANSKVVYQRFKGLFFDERFSKLVSAGANVQRLLWASTSAKNPNYPDTMYVDQLIGPDTVNTMPPITIEAFRDHGRVGHTLEQDAAGAQLDLDNLAELGIDLDQVTDKLQQDGVAAFSHSFDSLLATLEQKTEKLTKSS